MGKYIEVPILKKKAEYLIALHKAETMFDPEYLGGDKVAICVVDNGPFEAAAIAVTPEEFDRFNNPADERPKYWLKMDRKEAIRLCPDYYM
jgi:hypothetical protein